MASATMKKCRVCGKEYEACRSANRVAGVFHWQEVACSPECGAVYLQQINESRGLVGTPKRNSRKRSAEHQTVSAGPSEVTAVDVEQASEAPVESSDEE